MPRSFRSQRAKQSTSKSLGPLSRVHLGAGLFFLNGETMTFTRRKFVDGSTVWIYHDLMVDQQTFPVEENKLKLFSMVASREGVRFEGNSPNITDRTMLEQFAKAVAAAWDDHRSLVPQIHRPT